jgi:hypothetical protein
MELAAASRTEQDGTFHVDSLPWSASHERLAED